MVLRIDPRVPHVWRTPHELQFGVDRPAVRLLDVSNAQERMVAALLAGVTRAGLTMLGRTAGAADAEIDALIAALAPVLLEDATGLGRRLPLRVAGSREPSTPVHENALSVAIDGDGPAADAIAGMLRRCGHRVVAVAGDAAEASVDLAVLVGDYAISPTRYGAWLRRDVPHVAVVIGDRLARVGPLVTPGDGPCLYCLDLAKTDADPSWPAMAAQLLRRRAPETAAEVLAEVAARVVRAVREVAADGSERTLHAASVAIDVEDGSVSVQRHREHPACACRALPENVTVLGSRRAAPAPPSSETADVVLW